MNSLRNFRDVGSALSALPGEQRLRPGMLYRSGALDGASRGDFPRVESVISLRRTPDPVLDGVSQMVVAPRKSMNNYEFDTEIFGDWIQRVFTTLATADVWPVLLHCTAGKDRTGVVVALILKNLALPDKAILDEYMLSDGRRYPDSLSALLQAVPRCRDLQMPGRHLDTLEGILLEP